MGHVILICKLLFLTMTISVAIAQIILEEIYPIAPVVPTVAPSLEAALLQKVILDNSDFRLVIKAMLQESIKETIGENYAEYNQPESLDINKRLSHIYLSG